jgi:hypothetical protein
VAVVERAAITGALAQILIGGAAERCGIDCPAYLTAAIAWTSSR